MPSAQVTQSAQVTEIPSAQVTARPSWHPPTIIIFETAGAADLDEALGSEDGNGRLDVLPGQLHQFGGGAVEICVLRLREGSAELW